MNRLSKLFKFKTNKPKVDLISKFEEFTKAKIDPNSLYFLPLGGTGEFGLNLNAYYCDGKWLIVDLGVSFDGTSSINVFMPKIDFLRSIPRENILGIIVTHGHEDHVGAVQYLWRFLRVPVYTTPFTASLLQRKIRDMRGKHEAELHVVKMREKVQLGPFLIQWASVTHSIPDNSMVLIRTQYGNILHTGDWRFDDSPVIGEKSDLDLLEAFGKEGVLAVVGDSTNAMTEGKFASEEDVKTSLEHIIKNITTGRVVVVCFSTNLSRVDSCARIGQKVGRRVALVGRSLHRIKDVAIENGYLTGVPDFVTEDMVKGINPDHVLIVCTGSQGEPHSALRRFADNEHPKITLETGDTVIISARMITGKEKDINDMINKLVKRGIKVITTKQDADIHVSGHPPQDDLKRLYNIVKPRIGIPVHGEVRNLIAHRDLFRSIGVRSEFIENGDLMLLAPGQYKKIASVEFGQLGLDGKVLIPRSGTVLMERTWLGGGGCIFISIIIVNPDDYKFLVNMFGVSEHTEYRFRHSVEAKIEAIMKSIPHKSRLEQKRVISDIRNGLQGYIFMERGIDPKIFVHAFIEGSNNYIEVNPEDEENIEEEFPED